MCIIVPATMGGDCNSKQIHPQLSQLISLSVERIINFMCGLWEGRVPVMERTGRGAWRRLIWCEARVWCDGSWQHWGYYPTWACADSGNCLECGGEEKGRGQGGRGTRGREPGDWGGGLADRQKWEGSRFLELCLSSFKTSPNEIYVD